MNEHRVVASARCAAGLAVVGLVIGLSGCADIPPHMRVSEGNQPQNVDKDVRFRTTYFFRVFDYCYDVKAQSKSLPVADSLYRFVMTGQANAFASQVRFESGTLTAAQIDPFGATVEQDKETGRLHYVTEAEVQSRAQRSAAKEEIEGLIALKQKLLTMNELSAGKGATPSAAASALTAIDSKIADSINGSLGFGRIPESAARKVAEGDVSVCPAGSEIQRGFQIMGPQGIKTFNQDERLLMAMSTEAKGLLAALSQVSGRLMQTRGAKLKDADFLLALVREQLLSSELQRIDAEAGVPADQAAIDQLIDDLNARLEQANGAAK